MPQAANIVINDGKATPVAHTFVPSKISDLVATFNGPGTTLAGREHIVVTRREATSTIAGKVNIKLTLPTEVANADGTMSVSHQELVSIDLVLAPKSVSGERKDARVLASNLLTNASIAAVIDNMDGLF